MRWLLALCWLCLGCGDAGGDEHPDVYEVPPGSVDLAPSGAEDEATEALEDDVAVGPCKHELKRRCKVTLKIRNGIKTCAEGEQRCEGGQWSECRTKPENPGQPPDGAAGAAGASG